MAQQWAAGLTQEQYADERLYARDTVTVAGPDSPEDLPRAGDPVAVLAAADSAGWAARKLADSAGRAARKLADSALLVALGRVQSVREGEVDVRYTHRLFDEPRQVPVGDVAAAAGLTTLDEAAYQRLAGPVGAAHRVDADRAAWLVSVALPIEASSAAEAVREFWTYVDRLGPRELPAFVWPPGDELAMQAYVLGDEATLDPED